jgi:hypothetical protein
MLLTSGRDFHTCKPRQTSVFGTVALHIAVSLTSTVASSLSTDWCAVNTATHRARALQIRLVPSSDNMFALPGRLTRSFYHQTGG